jgi:hypothetical protein
MPEAQFDRLRSEVGDAVRQPDFGTVRARAGKVRRRRAAGSAAAFLVTVLSAVGLGYVAQTAPEHDRFADTVPLPAPTESPGSVWFRSPSVTNAGTHLYRVFERCLDCDPELYVSTDSGKTWTSRPTPPGSGGADLGSASLTALSPELVVWIQRRILTVAEVEALASGDTSGVESPPHRPWISRDAGTTWQQVVIDTQPLAAVPNGVRPVDCALLDVLTCNIGAIDPATGRFAPLAGQPTGITEEERWTETANIPLDGRLWVPGLDPVTNKPAVAISSDSGRTWRTHVFTGSVAAVLDPGRAAGGHLPRVAAGSGKVAYVLTYSAEGVYQSHYTADGGSTWRAGDTIRSPLASAGFVDADGSHIITAETGLLSARGTGRYTPVTLPGYPNETGGIAVDTVFVQVASGQAAEPYLVNSDSGPHLSADGRTWRRVRLP